MKKVFMSLAVVAAMFAVASCACCNNSENAAECCKECCHECKTEVVTECCKECSAEKSCCDSTKCADCDSTSCCKKAE